MLSGLTRLWRPSPCGRLSRPLTTMTPPTLLVAIGRLLALAFHQEPPTFTLLDSARKFRWRLTTKPIRSLRFPIREYGNPGFHIPSFGSVLGPTDLGQLEDFGIPPTSDRCLARKNLPCLVRTRVLRHSLSHQPQPDLPGLTKPVT